MARSPKAADVSPGREEPGQTGAGAHAGTEGIARRAYARYEARGREDGHDLDDWLEAEQEFRQGASGITTAGGSRQSSTEER